MWRTACNLRVGFFATYVPYMVVFADTDCKLSLPEEIDGVALLPMERTVSFICKRAKRDTGKFEELDPMRLLRCTRLYDTENEFCKGILADHYIECTAEDGALVRLDTTRLSYITVEHRPFRGTDKLYVTFDDATSGVFYTSDTSLTLHCLDGDWRTFALGKIRYVVF